MALLEFFKEHSLGANHFIYQIHSRKFHNRKLNKIAIFYKFKFSDTIANLMLRAPPGDSVSKLKIEQTFFKHDS